MNAFRITLHHRDAMPKFLEWCDEAAVVHGTKNPRSCRTGKPPRGVWPNPVVCPK